MKNVIIRSQILKVLFLVLIFIGTYSGYSEDKKVLKFVGDYLGKVIPGLIPQKFDTGQLTGDSHSFNFSFSPDGNELFFSYYRGPNEKKSLNMR